MIDRFDPQLLLETLDQVGDAVVVLGAGARVRFINRAARREFGLDTAQLLGRRLPDRLPELGEEPFRSAYLEAVRTRRRRQLRAYVRATQRWYDGEITPGAHSTTVAFREVTDRVRRELRDRLRAELAQAVSAPPSTTVTDTLIAALRAVRQVVGFEFAELWLVHGPEQQPTLLATDHSRASGAADFAAATGRTSLPPSSRVATAARDGRPVLTDDLAAGGYARADDALAVGLRGAIHLPVALGDVHAVLGWLHAGDGAARDRAQVIATLHQHLTDLLAQQMAHQDLDRVFNLSRDLVVVTDLEGRLRRVNPAWERTLGWSADELLGHHYDEFVHPDDLGRTRDEVGALLDGPAASEFENRFRAADGTYRTLLWTSTAVPEYGAIYSNARDVTAHVARRSYEQAQRELLVAIALNDPLDDTLTALTRMLESRLPDVTATALLVSPDATRLQLLAAPTLPEAVRDAVDGMAITDDPSCAEAVRRRATSISPDLEDDPGRGPLAHLVVAHGLRACWSIPFFDGVGTTLGLIVVYRSSPGTPGPHELQLVEDLAPLAGLAVMRARDEERLREREQRFELLARATSDAVWDWDLRTDALWWGDGVRSLFGYDPAALGGTGAAWSELIHPDDRQHVASAMNERPSDGDGATIEYRFRRADGTYAHVADRFYVVRDETGRARRALGGMTDLSERRRFEAEYLRAQRMESLGSLAGGIAHDLNNVLTPIVMAADLLELTDLDADQRDVLATLGSSARRGAEMVQQILRFARGDQPSHGGVDVRAMLDELQRMTREWFGKDLRLRTSVTDDVVAVRGDATQLHRVLVNLALNARDAMPDGGELTVDASLSTLDRSRPDLPLSPGRYVTIAVGDEGNGMPPEVVAQLFDPFFTTKGSGTGLGLPTCRSIVHNHEGHLQVATEPGHGSTFTLWLPAASRAEATNVAPPPPPRGRGETVLVADDEASVREITRQSLESYDYRVITARDGPAALSALAAAVPPVDLALMDPAMLLPGGGAPLESIHAESPHTRVVVTSGRSDRAVAASDVTIDGFLGKPYGSDELLHKVRAVLDG